MIRHLIAEFILDSSCCSLVSRVGFLDELRTARLQSCSEFGLVVRARRPYAGGRSTPRKCDLWLVGRCEAHDALRDLDLDRNRAARDEYRDRRQLDDLVGHAPEQ